MELTSAGQEPLEFGTVLAGWREHRGMSKRALAIEIGFDPSYISHIESGRHQAGEEFARRAEVVLSAGGELWRAWQGAALTRKAPSAGPGGTVDGLMVEDDHAELRYGEGTYTATMRRRILNTGLEPVTHYLVRISVDRYPGDPDRSNAHYRRDPLTWDELGLSADCDGERMHWRPKHDREHDHPAQHHPGSRRYHGRRPDSRSTARPTITAANPAAIGTLRLVRSTMWMESRRPRRTPIAITTAGRPAHNAAASWTRMIMVRDGQASCRLACRLR